MIRRISQIAGASFVISMAVLFITGQAAATVGEPPVSITVFGAIILGDIAWFMSRGLWLVVNEIFDKENNGH